MQQMDHSAGLQRQERQPPAMCGMTPLELDVQLQAAELVFRSMLEGRRVGICHPKHIDDWHAEALGEDWSRKNAAQREELLKQAQEAGENTPMWMEALAHTGDIAWEVFEAGPTRGERIRRLCDVDRTEVVEQFKELLPKLRVSYYARCGAAGHGLSGLRACVAVLRLFRRDAEVTRLCAECLRLMISDNAYSRDGLARLSLPMPPDERRLGDAERGWAFLRAALGALATQARVAWHTSDGDDGDDEGQPPQGGKEEEEDEKEEEPPPEEGRHDSVVLLAGCVVAAAEASALRAQLSLLHGAAPESTGAERRELHEIVPALRAKLQQEEPLRGALAQLRQLLAT